MPIATMRRFWCWLTRGHDWQFRNNGASGTVKVFDCPLCDSVHVTMPAGWGYR